MQIKNVLDGYMERVPEIRRYCDRCLRIERYGGNVVLMIVDASFMSIGVNYFTAVIPKVLEFREKFIETGMIRNFDDLSRYSLDELRKVWKNRRSWNVAREIAERFVNMKKEGQSDRDVFAEWAKKSSLRKWKENPIGSINGVGINTYQYLRMMGRVDTVMPDKIVKRVFSEIFEKAGMEMPKSDIEFVEKVESIARQTGYRAIELCWMTWLIQYEGNTIRMEKYREIMEKI